MKYVVSDIHGNYDLFVDLLSKINFNGNDKLYVLGDAICRGENSAGVLKIIMRDENIAMLRGNHEDGFISFLDDYWNRKERRYAFTQSTLDLMKYLHDMKTSAHSPFMTDEYHEFLQLPREELRDIHLFLKSMPLFMVVGGFILCHAGLNIPYDKISVGDVLKLQDEETLLWIREEFYKNDNRVLDKTIIFGHTPTVYIDSDNSDQIWKNELGDKIGIDCGAFFSGILACMRLDDMKAFYVRKKKKRF